MANRLARLLLALTAALLLGAGSASPALAHHISSSDNEKIRKEIEEGGVAAGIDDKGHYCELNASTTAKYYSPTCTFPPEWQPEYDDAGEAKKQAYGLYERWKDRQDVDSALYKKRTALIDTCLKDGFADGSRIRFGDCLNKAITTYPPPANGGVVTWLTAKFTGAMADAMEKLAVYIGESTVWLLQQFTAVFDNVSTIKIGDTGISLLTGLMTALSVLVATFLMMIQLGKAAITQQGAPLGTAIAGLAKWAVILAFYMVALQTALNWSDAVSDWIISVSFNHGDGASADEALKAKLGTAFAALYTSTGASVAGGAVLVSASGVAAGSIGAVIIVGIVCILLIAALWIELLLRQAGIMILATIWPVALAGQISEATTEWWPKARNALIALILMKPVIVLCFGIGFTAIQDGKGMQNVLVGMIIFVLSCLSWPALAKFMTFTTVGDGAGMASGLMSALSTSAASRYGYNHNMPGGGPGFSQGVQDDNRAVADGRGRQGGSFGARLASGMGLGMQALSAGKDLLEGAAGNVAAHAGLGQASQYGGHIVSSPRRGGGEDGAGAEVDDSPANSTPPPPSPLPATVPALPAGGTAAELNPGSPPPALPGPPPAAPPAVSPAPTPPAISPAGVAAGDTQLQHLPVLARRMPDSGERN